MGKNKSGENAYGNIDVAGAQEMRVDIAAVGSFDGDRKDHINNIENGRVSPTLKQLETIARALDMHINDLYESEYK